jgi:hypothetical protein
MLITNLRRYPSAGTILHNPHFRGSFGQSGYPPTQSTRQLFPQIQRRPGSPINNKNQNDPAL